MLNKDMDAPKICPVMSIGQDTPRSCAKEQCALWAKQKSDQYSGCAIEAIRSDLDGVAYTLRGRGRANSGGGYGGGYY